MAEIPLIDIRPDHWEIVRDILSKYVPQYEVWAFGSRAKWTAKPYSDLDIAIVTDKPLPLAVSAALADTFSDSDLPYRVDVVDFTTISESFLDIIRRDKVVLQQGRRQTSSIDWPLRMIGDVAEVFDGPHATPSKTEFGPIFLGINTLDQGRLNLSDVEHISEEDFVKWTRRVEPKAGDVVFSYETRLGEAALIPHGLRCCLGRRMGLIRPKKGVLDPQFFLYQYLSPPYQDFLKSRTIHDSTVDRLPLKEFPNFSIRLPPIAEQQAIASVLGALDDKIDLNRRMNETLDAMARAIYLDAVEDDWVDQTLGEVCTIYDGPHATPKTTHNGPIFLGISNLSDGQLDLGDLRYVTEDDFIRWTRRVTPSEADVVFSYETRLGQAAWIPRNLCCCLGRRMGLLRAIPERVQPAILLHAYLSPDFQETIRARTVHGSTIDRIPLVDMPDFPIRLPSVEKQRRIASVLLPVREKICLNSEINRTLAELRDLLLPKLMSGEIRLKDAERAVERAI